VAAQEPGQKHFMILQGVDRPNGRTLDEIATRSMADAGFKRVDGQATSLNGVDAFVGTYRGQLSGIGRVMMRAAHIQQGRQVYMLAGFAPEAEFGIVDRAIDDSIKSYRRLSQQEADRIRPNRLDFYTVRAGDTWQSIAARGGGLVRASQLAIMNNHAVNEQPPPGLKIKVVVAG